MKSFTICALSALFGSLANAAPVNKRDIVWVTEMDIETVVIPVTKTVWVDYPGATQEAVVEHHTSPSAYSAPTTTTSSSVYVAPSTSSTTSAYVAPTTSSTSVYVAPTTSSTSVYIAPTTSSTSVYVAPTTSSTSEYVAPATTQAPTSTYVAPTTSSSAPAATSSSSSGTTDGSITGAAAAGSSFSGDITYYADGLGACNYVNGPSDHIVAISHVLFDEYTPNGNPNKNPLCGMAITVTGTDGTQHTAEVVDRCVGCAEGDLDLSEDFFAIVAPTGNGRVHDIKWEWTSTRLEALNDGY